MDALATAALSLVALVLVFVPLERAFPARRGQPFLRPEFATDLAFFLGQALLWAGLAVGFLALVHGLLAPWLPLSLGTALQDLPLAARVALALTLGDLLTYWFHRACHHYEFLWRFHAVHHSAERLDWLAAHREHPLDGLLTQLCINLPGIVLGLSFAELGGLAVFRALWAIFIHSNIRLPIGALRLVLGAPELHHWHHARVTTRHNFSNLSPYWDLLFGTYHRPPDPEDYPLGLTTPWPRRYLAQLLRPFRPG